MIKDSKGNKNVRSRIVFEQSALWLSVLKEKSKASEKI